MLFMTWKINSLHLLRGPSQQNIYQIKIKMLMGSKIDMIKHLVHFKMLLGSE